MKKLVLGAVLSLGIISAAHAQTDSNTVYDTSNDWGLSHAGVSSGPYAKVGAGHSWGASSRFDDGWVYGGGIGYRFTPWFRTDATFDYRNDFHDSGAGGARFRNWSAMLNGYVDVNVPFIRPLIPFIGAGAGISQNKVSGTTVTVGGTQVARITGSSKDQFAWQAMAGVSYYFTPATALEVSYRYFHGGAAESGTATGFPTHSGDFDTHEVMAYLRIGF